MENTSKKRKKIILASVSLLVIAILSGIFIYNNLPSVKMHKYIDLGKKYLNELNYEQAVLTLTKALEIAPDDNENQKYLVEAYVQWAESFVSLGDYAKAKEVIERGLEQIDNFVLRSELEKIDGLIRPKEELLVEEDNRENVGSHLELLFEKGEEEQVGSSYGGVVPIRKGELWGAETYEGKSIVPCEYDDFRAPNENGYFVMIKSEGYDKYYYFFDRTGQLIYQANDKIVASGNMYMVRRVVDDRVILDMFDYTGKLLDSVETNAYPDEYIYFEGFYAGEATVLRYSEQETYYSLSEKTRIAYHPYELGTISKEGKFEWIDGDGFDEKDPSKTISFTEDAKRIQNSSSNFIGGAGGSYGTVGFPIGPANDGFFVALTREGDAWMVDKSGNVISSIFLWGLDIDKNVPDTFSKIDSAYGAHKYVSYFSNSEGYYGSDIIPFYRDGSYVYNRGSKMILRSNTTYALVDMQNLSESPSFKKYDYLELSDEKNWLVSSEGKWGYANGDGDIVEMFDDAAAFYEGHALIIESGKAYLIDDELKKLEEVGDAEGVVQAGELFVVKTKEKQLYYRFVSD